MQLKKCTQKILANNTISKWSNVTSPASTSCTCWYDLRRAKHPFCAILVKMYNLNVIMRKHQTNPILQNDWPVIFQRSRLWRQRLLKYPRLEKTKEITTKCILGFWTRKRTLERNLKNSNTVYGLINSIASVLISWSR